MEKNGNLFQIDHQVIYFKNVPKYTKNVPKYTKTVPNYTKTVPN